MNVALIRIVTTLLLLFPVAINLITALYVRSHTPADTVYAYPYGHVGDFYFHVSFLRQGALGNLLYSNPYTEKTIPILFHPFYNVVGFVAHFFTNNLPFVLFLLHLASLAFITIAIYYLTRAVFSRPWQRIATGFLVLFSTCTWTAERTAQGIYVIFDNAWGNYFEPYSKLHIIQSHHLLAFTLFIAVLYLLTPPRISYKRAFVAGLLCLGIGFLHTFILFWLAYTLAILFIVSAIANRAYAKELFGALIIIAAVLLPLGIYYKSIAWVVAEQISQQAPPSPLPVFFRALGPLVITLPLSLFLMGTIRKKPLLLALWAWGWSLFVMYAGMLLGGPGTDYRLRQGFQQIPLAFLAIFLLNWLITRLPKLKLAVITAVCALILYGAVPYGWWLDYLLSYIDTGHYNIFVPNGLTKSFAWLDAHSEPDEKVLSSETVGNMIPAYTHNTVLGGEPGSNPEYWKKVTDIKAFFFTKLSQEDAAAILRKYNIRYIFFGYETPVFVDTVYTTYPFITPVYEDAEITIASVDPSKFPLVTSYVTGDE